MKKSVPYQLRHDACAISYDQRHDAYYCDDHDMWLENTCGDKECVFCMPRPDKPGDVAQPG